MADSISSNVSSTFFASYPLMPRLKRIVTLDYDELLARQGNAASGTPLALPSELIIHIADNLADTELINWATVNSLFLLLSIQRAYRVLRMYHFGNATRKACTIRHLQ